nr:RGCVC family protein [Pseudonocardia endophytica]
MTEPNGTRPLGDGDVAPSSICPVCPHRRVDHDAISRRFCAARIAGSSGSGCVCRSEGGPA